MQNIKITLTTLKPVYLMKKIQQQQYCSWTFNLTILRHGNAAKHV